MLPLLRPEWPERRGAPGVAAAMSLRAGGVSAAPWASLNLGAAVGDDVAAVAENRARYAASIDARPQWLRQVHGAAVLRLSGAGPGPGPTTPADAAWTDEPGVACAVLVADCLPLLYAVRDGRAVAAAHAGWRGLAAGVVEATLDALCAGSGAAPADVVVWLGPCIGPRQFEVGGDVLRTFGDAEAAAGRNPAALDRCFVSRPRPDRSPRWLADLRALAQHRLQAAGVAPASIGASAECTVEASSRFFSFRRDGVTGRHAAAIWRC